MGTVHQLFHVTLSALAKHTPDYHVILLELKCPCALNCSKEFRGEDANFAPSCTTKLNMLIS